MKMIMHFSKWKCLKLFGRPILSELGSIKVFGIFHEKFVQFVNVGVPILNGLRCIFSGLYATAPPPTTPLPVGGFCPPNTPDKTWIMHGADCFAVVKHTQTYDNARADCVGVGGDLASLHDAHESAFVGDLLIPNGARAHWIGMRKAGASKLKD